MPNFKDFIRDLPEVTTPAATDRFYLWDDTGDTSGYMEYGDLPTGGAATYVVAASDAPQAIKDRADDICTGSGDEAEINAALLLGSVQLTQGTYSIDSPIEMVWSGVSLRGVGLGTDFEPGGTTQTVGVVGTEIRPSGTFSGLAAVVMQQKYDNGGKPDHILGYNQMSNFMIDGTDLPAGTVHGVFFRGYEGMLTHCMIRNMTGDGFHFQGNTVDRTFADGATTTSDATLTSATANFTTADLGRRVVGTGIPDWTYITAINSSTSVEMGNNATATNTGLTITLDQSSWTTYNTQASNLLARQNDGAGIYLGSADMTLDNITSNDNQDGIFMDGGSAHIVTNFHVYSNSRNGVRLNAIARAHFAGGKVQHSGESGICATTVGGTGSVDLHLSNIDFNCNGETTNDTKDHIEFEQGASHNNPVIVGCTFGNSDNVSNLARYCINLGSVGRDPTIIGCNMKGSLAGAGVATGRIREFNEVSTSERMYRGNVGVADTLTYTRTESGAAYTPDRDDMYLTLRCSNASQTTITIPTSTDLPDNYAVTILAEGAGGVTWTDTSITWENGSAPPDLVQGESIVLNKCFSNNWMWLAYSSAAVSVLDAATSTVSATNTTTETTLFTYTIPADTLAAGDRLLLEIPVNVDNGTSSTDLTWRFKLNAVTQIASAATTFAVAGNPHRGRVVYDVTALSTTSQNHYAKVDFGSTSAAGSMSAISTNRTLTGANTSSVDTSSDRVIAVTVQCSQATDIAVTAAAATLTIQRG